MPCYIPYHASKGDGDDDVNDDGDGDVVGVVEDDGNVSLCQASCGKRRRRRRGEKGNRVGAPLNCVALSNQILYYKYKYKYKCINSAYHQRMPPNRCTMLHVGSYEDIRHFYFEFI